jgi:homoserine kinase
MIISVPASSANLGPGFDTLGLALSMPLLCRLGPASDGRVETEGHPAVVAFRRMGGSGPLCTKTSIPSGRGLGFSGAARVAGALAAVLQRDGSEMSVADHADEVFALCSELEGHADNVAASLYGGCVATAAGRVVPIPLPVQPTVVVWIPPSQTSTDAARRALPATVRYSDAAFNVGRVALLVAALAAGDFDALRDATQDRLHQDYRLNASPASRLALSAALAAGAWSAWLSGSGPTVASFCAPEHARHIIDSLPEGGRAQQLRIDMDGARLLPETLQSLLGGEKSGGPVGAF